MNELLKVIQREYQTRVLTKSFILSTLLTPVLLSLLFFLPIYFAKQQGDVTQMKIGLVDSTMFLKDAFNESELTVELIDSQTVEEIKSLALTDIWEGIVYVAKADSTGTDIQYYSSKQPGWMLQNQIKSAVQKVVVNEKLLVYGIQNVNEIIHSAHESIVIENIRVGAENTETTSSPYQQPLCMILGVMIYLFVFMFSAQVMRGVQEEKTNRIVELIITSISPVKFMTGKIAGIALLGLTQIICWVVLIYGFTLFLSTFADISSSGSMDNFVNQRISQEDLNQVLHNLNQINFNAIIPAFVFFFVGGYLLYSSVFAAIAAAVNHGDDLNNITLLVTMPLILSIIILSNTMTAPDSALSYWFSIIPFTSPVIMMGRIVYGAPVQDIILSMFLLITTVAFIIWLSGKVYKTAILYTGKKITIKDIISWIRNSNQ